MSFASGRKLGLVASSILVIIPVLMVIPVGYYSSLLFSTISLVSTTLTGGLYVTDAPLPSFGSLVIPISVLAGIALIAFVMFMFGLRQLSQYYKAPAIFKNAIYGLILNLIATSSAIAVIITVVLSAAKSAQVVGNITTVAPMTGTIPILLILLISSTFVIKIVSAVFYMRAFNKLGENSGVHSFNKAGIIYLLGAVLIIVAIGVLLVWIAWIYAASGFNSLRPALL